MGDESPAPTASGCSGNSEGESRPELVALIEPAMERALAACSLPPGGTGEWGMPATELLQGFPTVSLAGSVSPPCMAPAITKRMAALEERNESVRLESCKIKRARCSDDLGVIANPSTIITTSSRKFKTSEALTNHVPVSAIESKRALDKMSITAKVLQVQPPTKVSGGLTKQDVTVADSTAATLWQGSVGCLEEEARYNLKNFSVCVHEKYLSMPREGSQICRIEAIGDVAPDDLPNTTTTYNSVTITAALISSYKSCIACNSKVVAMQDTLSKCTKCSMEQMTQSCSSQVLHFMSSWLIITFPLLPSTIS